MIVIFSLSLAMRACFNNSAVLGHFQGQPPTPTLPLSLPVAHEEDISTLKQDMQRFVSCPLQALGCLLLCLLNPTRPGSTFLRYK